MHKEKERRRASIEEASDWLVRLETCAPQLFDPQRSHGSTNDRCGMIPR
jgi:hypothetical protein